MIEPALTPEEWADESGLGACEREDCYLYRARGLNGVVVCTGANAATNATLVPAGPSCHALAALCLHGQPFGLTWDHVDALRACADDSESEWNEPRPHWIGVTRAAADLIAALLPPRKD
jgi:hypothetical protein